uniref:Reverse transcriptase domain-containing protein n=1 Tax=Solanum lycopersicum TaxID=4081 RepID=A0A3Q7J629_SOLLC
MVNHIPKLNGESACGPDGFSGFFPKLLGVLLPKKEEVKKFSDLRLISLSCFINKIISRMNNKGATEDISPTQSGFVKSVRENVLLAQDIIRDFGKRNQNINEVVKLDMSKAYDRVSWIFLMKVLRKFGFCEIIIDMELKTGRPPITHSIHNCSRSTGKRVE